MVSTECNRQLELFEVGRQVVTVDFEGGDVVTDTGLLPIRQLDQQLGILAEAARRLPDPRSALFIPHSVESLLSQRVYQILAGYPDGNDAQWLKHDPLFKTLAGKSPSSEIPLASGSTLNRFLQAYTRRERSRGGDLSRLRCAARQCSRTSHRRIEERLGDGPTQFAALPGELSKDAPACAGGLAVVAVPRSERGHSRTGEDGSRHGSRAVV